MTSILRSTAVAFLGIGALLSGIIAWFVFSGARSAKRWHAELGSLPAFDRAADGAICFLEGRVLSGQPLAGGFLAYERIRFRRSGHDVLGWETQVLRLATPHGEVELADPHYAFDRRFAVWWHAERVEREPTFASGAVVLRGFVEGSPLVAFGTAEARADGRVLRASSVVAGDLARCLSTLEGRIRAGRLPLVLALVCGIACAAGAFFQGRKLMQS